MGRAWGICKGSDSQRRRGNGQRADGETTFARRWSSSLLEKLESLVHGQQITGKTVARDFEPTLGSRHGCRI